MNPDELTAQNEILVRQWFEQSSFEASKLDADNSAKNADWMFIRSDVVVICEVKTIFSGGIGHGKEGREDSPGTYRHFDAQVKSRLETDPEIRDLPLSVMIAVDALYVPGAEQLETFISWIKQRIGDAQGISSTQYFQESFEFVQGRKSQDGSRKRSIEAFVQFAKHTEQSGLYVGSIYGGTTPNLKKFEDTIRDAVTTQIRSSINQLHASNSLATVALWSASNHLPPFSWLLANSWDKQQRYNLFDWAFREYTELSAIMLFEREYMKPICFVITSPFLPSDTQRLKQTLTTSPVRLIDGLIKPNEPNS